jgi:hypothetical protein
MELAKVTEAFGDDGISNVIVTVSGLAKGPPQRSHYGQ